MRNASDNPEEKTQSSKFAHELAHKNENPAENVAQWLEDVHQGTLCTISNVEGLEGFPYGSIVPFAIDEDGCPYILVAEIAAHTKNLLNSPKSCLFISHPKPSGDPQSHWRASIIGSFSRIVSPSRIDDLSPEKLESSIQVSEEDEENMLIRYCQRVPNAENYLKTHNFYFWKMNEIERVRYIAGFGKICWIEGDELLNAISDPEINNVKDESVEHMNEDHEDAMITICEGIHGFKPKSVQMINLDSGGIMMKSEEPKKSVYTPFRKRIKSDDLRVEIIKLVKEARGNLTT